MSDDESIIRQTLSSAKYRDPEKTRQDVRDAIGHFRGLKPVSELFVFNNGAQKYLLALSGTIPVQYKGTVYNIPIVIWLLDTHPYNAPMVFVKPTPDMRIKVSRHVDHNGKVYLPYLHDWKHGSSDLFSLIQVLIITFQEQPPVYAVLNSPPQPPMHQMPQPPGVPYPTQVTPYPPYPPSMPMPGMGGPLPNSGGAAFSVRPSLLTAAEEKLRRRLEDVYLSSEILKKTGDQLQDGRNRLEMMVRRLNDEKSTLEQNIETCHKECSSLQEKIETQKTNEDEAMIDDAIQAPTPLYKQIVNTFVEEAALEDTIYYLGEAFRCEKMDLDQYLKNVRVFSRRQFMLRAILNKCRQKAGLAG